MFTRAPRGGCTSAPTKTLSRKSAPVCVASEPSPSRRDALEQRRLPLPDPDAQRRQPVAAAPPAELVQKRHDKARAGHPEGVAERDRAAVDVHLFGIQPQLTDDYEALRGEGLVQLD